MNWPESSANGDLGDGRPASATDLPINVDSVREAITRRVEQGYAIYPQGGQTALDFGGIPRRPGVVIETRALDRVIDYPYADMTITIEAGMTLAALQSTLSEHRQRLPLEAPHPSRATLGGVYATNTSGPRRFGASRPRDLIIGVSFVTGDGALVKGGGRVVKNVAGYDFPKLLTGSMGTLGIITQLTLKVRPKPESSALVWAPFVRVEEVAETLDRLNTSGTRPVALELLNRSGARLIGAPLGLAGGNWVIVAGFEDNAAAVAWQLDRARSELGSAEAVSLEGERATALWSALAEFQALETGPLSVRANLRPATVVSFVVGLDPDRWAVQSHAGNGIVHAHAVGMAEMDNLAAEIERLRSRAVSDGGNLILPRCPSAWKERLRVWGEPRADWPLMERLKQALDPRGAMNPGRFVGTI